MKTRAQSANEMRACLDLVEANTEFVRVLEAKPDGYLVESVDHHYGTGPLDGEKMRLSELRGTARNAYLPEFDWSEVRI